MRAPRRSFLLLALALGVAAAWLGFGTREPRVDVDTSFAPGELERRLYVAEDGEVKVYDIDEGHAYRGRAEVKKADKFKGIAASAPLNALFLSSHESDEVVCLDLATHRELWRRSYGAYCDSLAITQDGRTLWVPCREAWRWYVVHAEDGAVIEIVDVPRGVEDPRYNASRRRERSGPPWTKAAGPHNTLRGASGTRIYMSAMTSPWVFVADVDSRKIVDRIGPFSAGVRPFAVAGDERRVFACVDGLLGFEVAAVPWEAGSDHADVLRVEAGPSRTRRKQVGRIDDLSHNTPSHGIAIRPGTDEVWIVDGGHGYLHVYDGGDEFPGFVASVELFANEHDRPAPGWVTFGIDGRFAYSSTGDVIESATRRIVAQVQPSERIIEVAFRDGRAVSASQR